MNIYSHLLGAVLFVILPFYVYAKVYPRYASAQLGDIIVFSTFFFGVAICFFLSASYVLQYYDSLFPHLLIGCCSFHIVANHSERVAARGNQLDYVGIVVLMWGSTVPSIYYGFYCDPKLQALYWLVVSDCFVSSPSSSLDI